MNSESAVENVEWIEVATGQTDHSRIKFRLLVSEPVDPADLHSIATLLHRGTIKAEAREGNPPAGAVEEVKPWRKKPVVIHALRWTGENLRDVIAFTGRHPSGARWSWEEFEAVVKRDGLKIFTLEGSHMATVGDYIIRGVKGEFYPCKPDIFEATYEPA